MSGENFQKWDNYALLIIADFRSFLKIPILAVAFVSQQKRMYGLERNNDDSCYSVGVPYINQVPVRR